MGFTVTEDFDPHHEQLEVELDWGKTPWQGRSPRSLTRVARGATCAVDNFEVEWASREADEDYTDAAQFTMFLKGTP